MNTICSFGNCRLAVTCKNVCLGEQLCIAHMFERKLARALILARVRLQHHQREMPELELTNNGRIGDPVAGSRSHARAPVLVRAHCAFVIPFATRAAGALVCVCVCACECVSVCVRLYMRVYLYVCACVFGRTSTLQSASVCARCLVC